MRKNTVPVLVCILWSLTLSAQKPSAQNKSLNFTDHQCIIPFRMVDRLMIIESSINGVTGFLCLDTGIEGLVIHDKYFEAGKAETTIVSSNGRTVASGCTYAMVEFACFSREVWNSKVMNLDHLTSNPVARVIGLVGWDMFKGFELQIDFRNRILRLFELDDQGNKIGRSNLSMPTLQTLPFRFKGPLPFLEARVGEEKLRLILDTGASVNVMRKPLYKRLSPFCRFLRMLKLRSWDTNVSEVPLTEVSGLMLGDVRLETMNTVWYDLHNLNVELEGPEMDGILGQELLKQYLLAINFTTLKLLLYHYEDAPLDSVVSKVPKVTADN